MKASSEDLLAGGIYSDYPTDSRISHARRGLADFYAARDEMAGARDAARQRARAEGRPIRTADVDEQLRALDDGGPLDQGEAVGND